MGERSQQAAEFTAFVTDSSRYLARTAYLLTGRQQLADDLVQEALTRTYAAWPRVRGHDALAYARRVLVNLTIDRHRRREPVLTEYLDRAQHDSGLASVDDRDEVARMLSRLTPRQRRIVVLRYYDDYTEAQTADCLGISIGTVKSACSRALSTLRDEYAPLREGNRA